MIPAPVAPNPALSAGIFFPVITTNTGFDQKVLLKNLMLFFLKKVRALFRVIQHPGDTIVSNAFIERVGEFAQG